MRLFFTNLVISGYISCILRHNCSDKNIYNACSPSLSFPAFSSLAHIFLILKAIAKKAKSIVTLSSPLCLNRRYTILYFICSVTASGSIHLSFFLLRLNKVKKNVLLLYISFFFYTFAVS